MKLLPTLGAAALVLTVPFAASAASMIKGQHGDAVRVNAAAYNLETKAGQQQLYSRLQRAARQVCGSTDLRRTGSLEQSLHARTCIKEAVAQAVEDVNHSGIRELHGS